VQRAIARRAVVTSTEKEVIRLRSMRKPMKVEKELPKGRMIMVLSMSTMKKVLTNLKLLEAKEVVEETMVAADLREVVEAVAMQSNKTLKELKEATMNKSLILKVNIDLEKEVNINSITINTKKVASNTMIATRKKVVSSIERKLAVMLVLDITKKSTTMNPIKRKAMLESTNQRSSNIRRERVKAVLTIRKRNIILVMPHTMRPILKRNMLKEEISQNQEEVLVEDSPERRLKRHQALLQLDLAMVKPLFSNPLLLLQLRKPSQRSHRLRTNSLSLRMPENFDYSV